jgi:hypothetical protein
VEKWANWPCFITLYINRLEIGIGVVLQYIVKSYPMNKKFTLYLFSLLLVAAAQSDPGPRPVNSGNAAVVAMTAANAGAVKFQFKAAGMSSGQDSVLIIFDKFNRTGAGVVYQMFAPDSTGSITVPAVPAGKYYVTIVCKGVHRDRVEKLVTVKAKKHEKVQIKLEASEVFSKDEVVIPAYRPSFSDMAILKSK